MNELRVENLRVAVADQEIVRGLTLTVPRGEICESKPEILVPRGVTVTQRPLEALFMVRIHAG